MLRTKLSRIIFLAGIAASFFAIHFTNALTRNGLEFSRLFEDIGKKPWVALVYLAFLFVPALIAATVVPWAIRWVKSGS